MTEKFDYEQLCPGIRNAVRWFHNWSWDTSDSGDGSFFESGGILDAMDVPMVVVPENAEFLCHNADLLSEDLVRALSKHNYERIDIQAMYNPDDGVASILVTGYGLLELKD